ncbi:MAG: CBS domain-containing protein [Euryarchaeota archaeon]|nr:CBS domain-containing protein [Euryarchaeota archaeon]MBU4608632.1 CBS domain-containing protein [Euryarchaeota archaeon]MBV1730074.1 CBS domain-containing protein [Methanobacterium sp.]MBV1754566.1 CBS domain-containing protein [Methanobacterium sp.]MBV1768418.1 CBS domain-containing protein [Methanobacterium sp.]
MLTSVQKEILQSLINLYRNSKGKSIKGEEIAEMMNRNPGTIRNQMQSLRSLGLVKGVPGPRGGYKPTIEAYHTLNITATDNEAQVPIYMKGEKLEDISVAKIEFTSIPHPGECEAAIKALGNIKQLDLGDRIRIGPTPVNKLVVNGVVVGRDDMDNILLLDTTSIRSIPKKTVLDVASHNLITLDVDNDIKHAAEILSSNHIEGAPVLDNDKKEVVGILTLSDITRAIAQDKTSKKVKNIMTRKIITVQGNVMIADAIEIMTKKKIGRLIVTDADRNPVGIVTRTDLLDKIAGLK